MPDESLTAGLLLSYHPNAQGELGCQDFSPPPTRRFVATAAATVLAITLLTPNALADDDTPDGSVGEYSNPDNIPGDVTGGDIASGPSPSTLSPEAEAKIVAAVNTFVYASGNTTEARQEGEAALAQYGLSATQLDASPTGTVQEYVILNFTQYAQTKTYYCGPATGYMMARYGNWLHSAWDSTSLTQDNLANANHMNTAATHVTSWTSGKFATGLNRWMYGSGPLGPSAVHQIGRPSRAVVFGSFVNRLGISKPLAADTVEMAGSYHYNNHPTSRTIGHWIAGHAYINWGNTICFSDPSTSVWAGVSPKFCYDTTLFTGRFLQSNGIAA